MVKLLRIDLIPGLLAYFAMSHNLHRLHIFVFIETGTVSLKLRALGMGVHYAQCDLTLNYRFQHLYLDRSGKW